MPLEALMIETDCPYMAPVPYRGKRCEPALVGEVAKTIAAVKDIEPALAAETTTATAQKFFRLRDRLSQ